MGLLTPSFCLLLAGACVTAAASSGSWLSGQGKWNWRRAIGHGINADNAHNLMRLFSVNTSGADVSATPTIAMGNAYFADWHGFVWSVSASTGAVNWKVDATSFIGGNSTYNSKYLSVRTSPALDLDSGLLVIGMQANLNLYPETWVADPPQTAYLLALKMSDGSLVWKTLLSDNGWAIITTSPSIHNGAVYGGVSSNEELAADSVPGYNASFRGSAFKLDLATGEIIWTAYMAPNASDPTSATYFPGNAVWGSSPVLDKERGLVYIATGNNYDAPPNVIQCINDAMSTAGNHTPDSSAAAECGQNIPENLYNSVVALDDTTGQVAWYKRFSYFDVWNDSCGPFSTGGVCSVPYSDDFDFAQEPLYIPNAKCGSKQRDILVAAQKSGSVYGIDAETQATIWSTYTGVGTSEGGGAMWGSAFDGVRTVFVPNANANYANVTLVKPAPDSDKVASGGFANAIDICTGEIKWQAAGPNKQLMYAAPVYSGWGAKGVVFFPTLVADGTVYGFSAVDGRLVAEFNAGPGSLAGGPSIVDGKLYIGTGYRYGAPGSAMVAYSVVDKF